MLINAQMSITATEHASQLLIPDVLQGFFLFDEQSKNINNIKTDFNAIVDEVKKFDPAAEYCIGSGYNFSPLYNSKSQKPELIGYGGHLQFNCEFNTIEQYNRLNESIKKIVSNRIRTSQSAFLWKSSDKTVASVEHELQLSLLRKAKIKADSFSKETSLECEVSTLKFDDIAQAKPATKKEAKNSVSAQSTIQSNKEHALTATVVYKCAKNK